MKIADSIPRKQSHSGNEWNAAAVSDVTKEIVKTNPFEDGITTAVLPKRSQIDSVNAQQFVLDDGITSSDFAKTNPFGKCAVLRSRRVRTPPAIREAFRRIAKTKPSWRLRIFCEHGPDSTTGTTTEPNPSATISGAMVYVESRYKTYGVEVGLKSSVVMSL